MFMPTLFYCFSAYAGMVGQLIQFKIAKCGIKKTPFFNGISKIFFSSGACAVLDFSQGIRTLHKKPFPTYPRLQRGSQGTASVTAIWLTVLSRALQTPSRCIRVTNADE
jgi:hypothetical protein